MKSKSINSHDLLNVYSIPFYPHTNPTGHIIFTATNITYVITITILQMREPRHREGTELPKTVNGGWGNRDLNPGSLTPECKLYLNPGVWWEEKLYLWKTRNTMRDNIVLKCGSNYKCCRNSVWRGTPSARVGLCARHCTGGFHPAHKGRQHSIRGRGRAQGLGLDR